MAVLFDAVGEALYRDTNLPTPTGSWTVAFWVYFNQLTAATLYDAWWLHTPTGGSTSYTFYGAEGAAQYYEHDNGNITASSAGLVINTWYHFALTCNAGAAPQLYRDGVLVATASGAVITFTPARMRWGNNPTAGRTLNGRLAYLKVWDAALSQSEIVAEKASPNLVRTIGINCFYKLDDAASAATDSSGLGRTATITGTPTTAVGPPIVLLREQYAYRFRNDDGSETTATWKAAQNTAATITPDQTFRLRFGLNATGDLPSEQYKVQVRKVGDADYRDIDTQG